MAASWRWSGWRRRRRSRAENRGGRGRRSCDLPRGPVNGATNPLIGTAAAEILRHHLVDIRVAGFRLLAQQVRGPHDLARLAVAALRHLFGDPGLLYRMAAIARETLDREH